MFTAKPFVSTTHHAALRPLNTARLQQHQHQHRSPTIVASSTSTPPQQQSDQQDQQEIENLNRNYCDDFVCTSSPAIEATVRALARDLLRANGNYTRSIFSAQKAQYKGFRSFQGVDGYKTLTFVPKHIQKPTVTIQKMQMLDVGTAEIKWTLRGLVSPFNQPVDVRMTTTVYMNLLTGQIERHEDAWDVSQCSGVAGLAFTLATILYAVQQGTSAAAESTESMLNSLSSTDEGDGSNYTAPNPMDPGKFLQQGDTFKDDALFFLGAVALLYVMTNAWATLFKG